MKWKIKIGICSLVCILAIDNLCLTESVSAKEKIQIENYKQEIRIEKVVNKTNSENTNLEIKNVQPISESYFPISDSDKEIICNVVAGEAGTETMEGKMAVAQCYLNGLNYLNCNVEELRIKMQYNGYSPEFKNTNPELWQECEEAVSKVFDNGEKVTEEFILWFYSPKYSNGTWHQTQKYCGTFGTQKFYAPWN